MSYPNLFSAVFQEPCYFRISVQQFSLFLMCHPVVELVVQTVVVNTQMLIILYISYNGLVAQ